MPLKAVFLDVGNTLLYEEPSRFAIYANAARQRGADVDAEAMTGLMRKAHRDLPRVIDGAFRYSDPWFAAYIRKIFHTELGIAEEQVPQITRELFTRFEDPATFRTYPGAFELIEALRSRDLVLGVISNWSARLPRVLRALGLEARFDFVLCSAIERMEKPELAIFAAALERAGVSAAEALHAGDHPEKDARAAREAGLEAVLVDHPETRGAKRPEGDGNGAVDGETVRVGGLNELSTYILGRIS